VRLVLCPGAGADQGGATRAKPPPGSGALVRHPDLLQRPCPQQLGQRARVEAIGLRPGLRDLGQTARVGDHDLAHVGADQRGDRRRVGRALKGHPIVGGKALGEQANRLLARLDPSRRHQRAGGVEDRHLDELEVAVESDPSHRLLLLRFGLGGAAHGRATRRDSRSRRSRARSQGRPRMKSGSQPIETTACPLALSCVCPCGRRARR
jgi:hypothetical protein